MSRCNCARGQATCTCSRNCPTACTSATCECPPPKGLHSDQPDYVDLRGRVEQLEALLRQLNRHAPNTKQDEQGPPQRRVTKSPALAAPDVVTVGWDDLKAAGRYGFNGIDIHARQTPKVLDAHVSLPLQEIKLCLVDVLNAARRAVLLAQRLDDMSRPGVSPSDDIAPSHPSVTSAGRPPRIECPGECCDDFTKCQMPCAPTRAWDARRAP